MARAKELSRIYTLLRSEKSKDRQDGYQAVRDAFRDDASLETEDEDDGDKKWLAVFQTLFGAVLKEKAAYVKKGVTNAAPVTKRRLGDAASVVRWLAERTVTQLRRSILRALIDHLHQTMVYRGGLLEPVALDYAKSIRTLLSHQPHLDRLDDQRWTSLLHFSFSVLLNDRLAIDGNFEEEEEDLGESSAANVHETSDLSSDDDSGSPRKRRRRESPSFPTTKERFRTSQPTRQPLSLEQIELAGVIRILLSGPSAPYISSENPQVPVKILRRFKRFYTTHPADSSAHYDVVAALNSILSNLSLNAMREVSVLGHDIWAPLMESWNIRHKTIKERLLVAFRQLLPFVTHESEGITTLSERATAFDNIRRLCRLLDAEADVIGRGGLEPLAIDQLRLQLSSPSEQPLPFQLKSIRPGNVLGEQQALTWTAMELYSDCLSKLYISYEDSEVVSVARAGKRAKLDEPITPLLEAIGSPNNIGTPRVYRFQVLLFLIDRHWNEFHASLRDKIRHLIYHSIGGDDHQTQQWAFLCLATIAVSPGAKDMEWDWDVLWSLTWRRWNVPAVSRSSCHASLALIKSGRVDATHIARDIETMTAEMAFQGPPFPYDSVCAFVRECSEITRRDMRLYKVQLQDKALSWLVEGWNVLQGTTGGFNAKSKVECHSIGDVLSLASSLCGLKHDEIPASSLLPECFVVEFKVEEERLKATTNYMLHGHVDGSSLPGASVKGLEGSLADQNNRPNALSHKFSNFLERSLHAVHGEWESRDLQSVATAEKLRRSFDLSALALYFQATLRHNGYRDNRKVIQAACDCITALHPVFRWPSWTPQERALIIEGLAPLIQSGHVSPALDTKCWESLADPGYTSGISDYAPSAQSPPTCAPQRPRRSESQRLLWESSEIQESFESLFESLRDSLYVATGIDKQGNNADQGDDFGVVLRRENMSSASHSNQLRGSSLNTYFGVSVSLLTAGPMLQMQWLEPPGDPRWVDVLLDFTNEAFLVLSTTIWARVASGECAFGLGGLDRVMDDLEYRLQDPELSHNPRMHSVVITLLQATIHIWIDPSAARSPVARKARAFFTWLVNLVEKGRCESWHVRDHIICLLDHYIAVNPSQAFWDREEDEMEANATPKEAIKQMLQDNDVRVRCRAAIAVARLFRFTQNPYHVDQGGQQKDRAAPLYLQVTMTDVASYEKYEHNLVRLLLLANIMIVSSEVRRAPYADVLGMSLGSGLFNSHIEQLIAGVIHKIAFSSPKQLFETYAASVTLKFIEDRRDISRLAPSILGYLNRRESGSAFLRLGLPLALLDSDEKEPELWRQFRHVTTIVGISEEDALKSIFPYRTALKICSIFDGDDYTSRVQSDALWQTILSWSSSSSHSDSAISGVVRHLDAILTHMLLVVGEIDAGPAGDLSLAIRSSIPAVADDLAILTKFQSSREPLIHRPSAPLYGARAVLQAIAWLERHLKTALPVPETLYHVAQRLFRSIMFTPLVNEKVRGINAVCVLCALYAPVFENSPTLLRNVMFGMTPILAHPALYHRAQSIIHWACNVYARTAKPDSRFPEFLIRMANIAAQLCKEREESENPIGTELLEWVQEIGLLIQSTPDLAGQAKSAMLLWPRSISTSSTANEVTYRDISQTLSDGSFTSNKFRLVQRLQQLIREKRNFRPSHADFWTLKACIPSDAELVDADLEAYLDVLAAQAGRVSALKDAPARRTLGQRHQSETRSSRKAAGSFMLVLPHYAIIGDLLDRMHLSTVAIRDVAYQSLRLLLSLQNNHLDTWKSPPEDITLLASRPIDVLPAKQAQIDELGASAYYVDSNNFPHWIRSTTQFMCDVLGNVDPFYAQLQPVVDADEGFAAELFPVAVHELLRRQDGGVSRKVLSEFFRRVLNHKASSVPTLQTIVETCLHLRNFQHNPIDDSATGNNRWLDIAFPMLSMAAVKCGSYTTALLFLELGRETATSTLDAYMYDHEFILYDIYSHIEEPDGFYGIKSQDVARFLVRRFRHENEWDKAFRFDGAALEALPDQDANKSAHSIGVVQALHASGLDHLAVSMLQTFRAEHSSTDIELAWRTENWELPISASNTSPSASLFVALRSTHRQEEIGVMDTAVDDAVRREIGYLRDLGDESMAEVRSCVRRLLCLREVKDWSLHPVQEALASNDWSPSMANRWGRVPADYQYADLEPVLATRISLIHSAQSRFGRAQIGNMRTPFMDALMNAEKQCLLHIARSAREASLPQIALKCVTRARYLEGTDRLSFDTSNEFGHVLWAHSEEKLAIETVDQLLQRSEDISPIAQALSLSQQGEWLAAACLKPPMVIRNTYFDTAYQIVEKLQETSISGRHAIILFRYALFAERQYQAVVETDESELLRHDMETKRKEVLDLDSLISSETKTDKQSSSYRKLSQDRRKAALLLDQDSQKYKSHVQKIYVFLRDSIRMFAGCLRLSDMYDDDVLTRLCSLWFRNFDDEQLQKYINASIANIPSRKFIFFAHQLTALLSTSLTNGDTQSQSTRTLHDLVLKLSREHPYHCLYQLHALRMGDGTEDGSTSERANARQQAAATVLNQVRGRTIEGSRLQTIEQICEAYIEWAVWAIPQPDPGSQNSGVPIPRAAKLVKLEAPNVPIPTIWTPVDPTCEYKNVVGIRRYASKYKTSGGVNLPKINDCYGTDGKIYRQVFKGAGGQRGGDDLRQDAVIGQVFELANQVLRKDPQTRRRELSVRTYKIIPLTTQAGVLEFVADSQPLQEWLSASHKRYYKNDYTLGQGQQKLKDRQMKSDRSTAQYPAVMSRLFREIKARFHPVLRHYFLERYMVPGLWFQMRLAYSRSVATTSIVGHVVGLGDRHISNILIDQNSGELIHIDLGIAFDQGQLLPIPEGVPFRLTEDIVDGLGMSRTEGVFRRCAEETLRVLRDRSEVVETVLQVFKHDPLHSWTANPFKLRRAQDVLAATATTEVGSDRTDSIAGDNANRAIRGVRHKLDKSLSVQYTVNELITSATDEHNLCLIFGGWSPHA